MMKAYAVILLSHVLLSHATRLGVTSHALLWKLSLLQKLRKSSVFRDFASFFKGQQRLAIFNDVIETHAPFSHFALQIACSENSIYHKKLKL